MNVSSLLLRIFVLGGIAVLSSCEEQATRDKRDDSADGAHSALHTGVLYEVLETSAPPDPDASEYASCLFTARLRVIDAPDGTGEGEIVMGTIPAFIDRTLQAGAGIRPGDRIRSESLPYEQAPDNFRQMQLADAFGDYLLDVHFLPDVEIVSRESGNGAAAKVMVTSAGLPPEQFVRPDDSSEAGSLRKARLEKEKARIAGLKAGHGGSWDAWMERLRPVHAELRRKAEAAGGALKKDNLYFSKLDTRKYEELASDDPDEGPTGALRLLNAELHRRGIDLLVVPFPAKEDVNAHHFAGIEGEDIELNPQRLRFHMNLLEHNIEVLDLAPALRRSVKDYDFLYFDNRDVHPVGGGLKVAGREIANVLRDYGLGLPGNSTLPIEKVYFEVTNEPAFVDGSRYPAARVLIPADPQIPTMERRRVVFQGDSFLNVPSLHVQNATIVHHVGRYLGFEPQTVLREGGANRILQDLARMPKESLEGCKVMVFVFGPTRLRSHDSKVARAEYRWHLAPLPPGNS
jgi:hypothetical protein